MPKGVMLCGMSGGGKSQLAKLIAAEFNFGLLRLDIGSLFGPYVGEAEQQTRDTLRVAEALSPVVLWIDEIDKAFVGAGSGSGDSGVSARVFGHLLTWLAEKKECVFVVVTANDVDKVLGPFPEFGRKGRFDEIFYVGYSDPDSLRAIWRIYLKKHMEDRYLDAPEPEALFDELAQESFQMTGAEIESAVQEALWAAYDQGQGDAFTPALLIETAKKAAKRRLYQGKRADDENEAIERARQRGWVVI